MQKIYNWVNCKSCWICIHRIHWPWNAQIAVLPNFSVQVEAVDRCLQSHACLRMQSVLISWHIQEPLGSIPPYMIMCQSPSQKRTTYGQVIDLQIVNLLRVHSTHLRYYLQCRHMCLCADARACMLVLVGMVNELVCLTGEGSVASSFWSGKAERSSFQSGCRFLYTC